MKCLFKVSGSSDQLYCSRCLFTKKLSINSYTWMTMELSRSLFVLCLYVTISSSVGNSVEATKIPRVIAVTSGPYEAGIAGTSFSCLVSEREENPTAEIKRYVRQGADVHTYSLDLPHGHAKHTISDQVQSIFLPANSQAQGTYTCRIFKNGQNHDVPITLLQADRRFEAQDGRPTVTVNAGERAILICEKLTSVLLTEIVWIKLSDFSTVKISGTSLLLHSTSVSDADVYGCHVNGLLSQARLGVIRLIVRACPSGKWNPPACHGICDMCYNGGICDDKTGECVCPPGFAGRNCLNICAVDYFGWDCEFQCGVGQPLQLCAGSHICMPDPYGCSCVAGFTGTSCMDVCHSGMFGAGCTQTCHCAAGDCLPHSGECMHAHAGCASGWSGQNCQIPDHCPAGYFGEACTDICHCENDHSCERDTGQCPEGKCAPGFISSTGVNLANCQQFVGCISQCTRTCHCSDGEADCITDSAGHHSGNDGMCVSGMCASQWVGPNCQSGIIEQTSSWANPGQPFQVSCAIINLSMMPEDVRHAAFLRQGSPNNASSFTIYISTDQFYSFHGTHFGYGKQDYMVSGIYPQDQLFCVHETSDGMAVAEVTLHFYALPVLGVPPTLIGSGDTWIAVMWPAWNSSNGDLGEGPIVSYNLYLQKGNGEWALEVTVPHSEHVTEHMQNVTDLMGGSTYSIAVTVIREGEGGEGERSSPITVTTVTIGTTPLLPDETSTADTTVFGNNTPAPATSTNVGAIVFSVLCLVLVILSGILLVIFWRNRRSRQQRQKQFEISSYKAEGGVTLDDRGIQSSAFQGGSEILIPSEEGSLDEPVTDKPVATVKPSVQMEVLRPVPVGDFVEYFWSSLDSGYLIKQWEALPEDLTRPCEVAKKEDHKPRNRYRNILPYDHNRVVLKDGDDTEEDGYINASYIKGDNGNQLYIASQGPNTASVNDFWRMIWQEDVGKIVMATNLIEEGKNKCFKYWPDVTEGEATFGSVLVETSSEDVLDCCVIRYFTVRYGEDRRRVVQFHYIKWPDKTVPRDTSSVMRLLDVIKDTPTQAMGPTVVHCSAGAGRSGVLLAFEIQKQRIEITNQVDVFNCVLEMRTERPWMVQTADQYVFLHRLIMEFLLCKNTFIEKDVFSTYACKIQESNPETGETELTSQFKILGKILPALRVDPEAAGLQPENQNKNRDSDIVPVNRYRPYLITEVDVSDSTNYINASFIDGISSTSEFVTTQMPLPHTIIDFWRLVHDYQVQTVVLLNSMDKRDETCQPYWGLGEPLVCGDLFRITTTAVTKKGDIVERTLVLENLVTQTISEIKQFQLKKWPNLEIRPPSMSRLAIFIQLVKEYVAEAELTGPILVHCMSGVSRSGIFCAVLSCLRQLDEYGGVDILQTVKQLKLCQPLLIQSELEFSLVYEIISLCTSPEMCLEEEDGGRRREEGESMYENAGHSSSEMLDSESLYENLGFKAKSLRHSGIMQMDSNA